MLMSIGSWQALKAFMAPEFMESIFKTRLTQREWKVLEDIKAVLEVCYSLLPFFFYNTDK
jgi:hypothetical protein